MATKSSIGIVVSGGPAPGINCVIASAAIEANNRGYDVYGLRDGFKAISLGERDCLIPLETSDVAPIYATGGSILGTSRFNPFSLPEHQSNFVDTLREKKIDKLVVIGGDGSAVLSYKLSQLFPEFRIAHVPKTIDNDLVLPNHHPSFGFETACYGGTTILKSLAVDARTTKRWFLITTMGRRAGFLALGIGTAAAATLTVIPEEFAGSRLSAQYIANLVFESMQKRAQLGKPFGIAVLAEGILDCIDPESSPILKECPRDEMGRLIYSEVELGDILIPILKQRCKEAGFQLAITEKNIGYELRCRDPISFDIEYTKFLGNGAARYLTEPHLGKENCVMVTKDYDKMSFKPLKELVGADGRIKSRTVDLNSDMYKVARSYMIR